ncbi:Tetratricopeptide repeat-like superfamily protein [Theobroma cacao]|uniref:Tetratricopeptide repeat-like superfamily protein n=1 Tax=Theobroma cacao TaxID=3641 RepID=A0A061EL52_THECC|nr:Tetratricopeptide repeat-like superfamily protein [Theobroma cacao]
MFVRKAAVSLLRRVRLPSQSIYVSASASRPVKATATPLPFPLSSKIKFPYQIGYGSSWRMNHADPSIWIILSVQAAIILGINVNHVLAEDVSTSSESDEQGANIVGLCKIEDGSVISNIHTSKWRVFTDNGRDYFLQGKLEEAEKFFLSALKEAKEGFGERDSHVASACNNLAELYRVKKAFDKAEPLYLEAINILEEAFGSEDIRVGVALHNLGQFYLVQRKLEESQMCYERALKIKGRVLGHSNIDYADTMYHLGTVLYLQGKVKDSEVLILDSIRILEEGGQGESIACIRRLRYLAQMYIKSNRTAEAENVQRKILHIVELSKGWNSLDTVIAAERLALTLQSSGSLKEAQELLERCLDARKTLLPEDHLQIGANMLHIARVVINSNQHRRMRVSDAIAELDKAKGLLNNSMRIAWQVTTKLKRQERKKQSYGVSGKTGRDGHAALIILLQSLDALGLLEISRQELQKSGDKSLSSPEAKTAHFECISAYKEFATERSIRDSPEEPNRYLPLNFRWGRMPFSIELSYSILTAEQRPKLDHEKKKRSSSDGLAQVKAAAWAWYQHGSGSEGKPIREFDITRTERASSSRPSRYKLEAMRNNTGKGNHSMEMEGSPSQTPRSSPNIQTQNSPLDSYETKSIAKRLNHLIEFGGIKFYKELLGIDGDYQKNLCTDGARSGSDRKKTSNKYLKGFLLRRKVVCGRRQDVDDRAVSDDRRRLEKQMVNPKPRESAHGY